VKISNPMNYILVCLMVYSSEVFWQNMCRHLLFPHTYYVCQPFEHCWFIYPNNTSRRDKPWNSL
jgi:hypothetical protein